MRVCNCQEFNCELAMKAAPFGYHRVSSVGQAVEYLAAYEGTARVLAGGQSLAPMLNMRLLRPDALIDINGIDELADVRSDGDTTVLGALVRHATVEYSPLIADRLAMMATVVRHIGDRQVRNRGTIGGSLAHGDPTGELPLACLALGASVRVSGPGGARELPVARLYAGPYATVLDACEVITAVVFPAAPAFHAFAECCRRHNDFAVVSVACAGNQAPDGRWRDMRIALGGVADCPVLAEQAGELLAGSELADDDIAAAAEAALAVIDPPDDIRASAAYRRHLVPVYVRRVLTEMRATALAGSPEGEASDEVA
jgi:aerobic carbon-monoxide dehydrogenase medium subunit